MKYIHGCVYLQNEVETNIALLQEKTEEMTDSLTKMETRESVGIDDVVFPTAPLYRQYASLY